MSTPIGKRTRRIYVGIVIVLLAALVSADLALHVVEQQRIDNLHSRVTSDSVAYNALLDKYGTVYGQLSKAGVTPTETAPQDIKQLQPAPGATGATGSTGATGADGRGIIATECSGSGLEVFYSDGSDENAGDCVGPPGATGAAGATGPAGPAGTAGATGASGTNGTDSAVPGPAGPTGATGATGAAGKDGRSVSDMACNADGTWTITYSDSTTETVAGPCRVDPTDTPTDPTGETP